MRTLKLNLERVVTVETTKEKERVKERLVTPITAIVSSIPLQYNPVGLYQGHGRDVLVIMSKALGEQEVPQRMEEVYGLLHIDSSVELIDSLLPRIDCMVGYLGVGGASAGFEYIRERMQTKGGGDVELIASEEQAEVKKQFAVQRFVPILWVNYGTEARMLEEIAADARCGQRYAPRGQIYI